MSFDVNAGLIAELRAVVQSGTADELDRAFRELLQHDPTVSQIAEIAPRRGMDPGLALIAMIVASTADKYALQLELEAQDDPARRLILPPHLRGPRG